MLAIRMATVASLALPVVLLSLPKGARAADGVGIGSAKHLDSIPAAVASAERNRIAAAAKAMPATVSVFVPGGAGGGSGVLISPDGFALTNFHVSSPAGEYMRCGLSDGNIYDAVIVGIDPVGDLAMIQLLGRDDFPAAEFGDSLNAKPGDWAMAIGNPFLLATDLQPTVSWGILSGVGRYQYPSGTLLEYGDCLQTDASINPGNSGGPLFDAGGRLLGIIGRCSFEKRGRVNVGVGYAISIRQAQNFLGYLRSGRIVDHATLGATVSTDPEDGVRVTNILTSSDAYRRGLRFNSEILEIDGRPVVTANDVQNILATLPANWRVKLSFREDGQTIDTLVRLASVHQQDELIEKMSSALPPPPPRSRPKPKPAEPQEDKSQPAPGDDNPTEGGKGEDAKDNRKADEDAPGENPSEEIGPHVASKLPEAVRQRLIKRRGYANYHFNQVQQDAFIRHLRQQRPADGDGVWIIKGKTVDQNPQNVQMRIADDRLAITVGQEVLEIASATDRALAIEQQKFSVVAVALDAWRNMLKQGTDRFGETYYLGTMPLGGERPLRDCVVGLSSATETRFLSHPTNHRLEAIEVFLDRDSDPAELWIEFEGDSKNVPSRLDLRFGTESLLRVDIESWQAGEGS